MYKIICGVVHFRFGDWERLCEGRLGGGGGLRGGVVALRLSKHAIRSRADGVGCCSEGPNKRRCICSGGGGGGVCVFGRMHAVRIVNGRQ